MKTIIITSEMIAKVMRGKTIEIIPAVKYHEHVVYFNKYVKGFTYSTFCLN